jgi:hypothetical protein
MEAVCACARVCVAALQLSLKAEGRFDPEDDLCGTLKNRPATFSRNIAPVCAHALRFMRRFASKMSSSILQVKRLSEHAVPPARASAGAAGYDLCR